MTEAEVSEQFRQIIASSLRIDPSRITADSGLDDELGVESLDLIEITMEAESRFNVWLPEKSILESATEVFGPDVLESDGVLTPAAKQLLLRRLPAEDSGILDGETTVTELRRYFLRVQTWVHMIHSLMEHSPAACDACGGGMTRALGFHVRCAGCGKETELRS